MKGRGCGIRVSEAAAWAGGGTHEAGFVQWSEKISEWKGYVQSGVVDGRKGAENGEDRGVRWSRFPPKGTAA